MRPVPAARDHSNRAQHLHINIGDYVHRKTGYGSLQRCEHPIGTGTVVDFVVTSPEAINIPYQVRTSEIYRNSEAARTIVPAATGIIHRRAADMVLDSARPHLHRGLRAESRGCLRYRHARLAPVKLGQLPRSLAMTPDGYRWPIAASKVSASSNPLAPIPPLPRPRLRPSSSWTQPPVPFHDERAGTALSSQVKIDGVSSVSTAVIAVE